MAGYLVAKGGIEAMVRGLARELGPSGIRVVGVVPGAIDTERQRRLWQTPDRVEQILATQAIRQRLDGWDIAQMVLFLASDNARGCTAQCYVVDAGLT
jgi:NAD(P)-dependent dehydrogenase (short-subunit alcohol dehydrogenase family)